MTHLHDLDDVLTDAGIAPASVAVDILDAIDQATGCQQCGLPLGASPSDDFCDDECQERWHAGRAVALVGYREPWDDGELPGVGSPAYRHRAPFRLPPQTASLAADWAALLDAELAATTPAQVAAVRLRGRQLAERTGAAMRPTFDELAGVMAEIARAAAALVEGLKAGLAAWGGSPAHHPDRCPTHAQRGAQRHHGPPQRRRPPRTIGRPSTARR